MASLITQINKELQHISESVSKLNALISDLQKQMSSLYSAEPQAKAMKAVTPQKARTAKPKTQKPKLNYTEMINKAAIQLAIQSPSRLVSVQQVVEFLAPDLKTGRPTSLVGMTLSRNKLFTKDASTGCYLYSQPTSTEFPPTQ